MGGADLRWPTPPSHIPHITPTPHSSSETYLCSSSFHSQQHLTLSLHYSSKANCMSPFLERFDLLIYKEANANYTSASLCEPSESVTSRKHIFIALKLCGHADGLGLIRLRALRCPPLRPLPPTRHNGG